MHVRGVCAAIIAASMIALTGCAADAFGGDSPAADEVSLPHPATTDELTAAGTVLQRGDEDPQLCLGGVAESLPPQCAGPVIHGWDWAFVQASETSSDVTWGTYVVHGTWDGVGFTITRDAIPLSPDDPMPGMEPSSPDEKKPGVGVEAELLRVQRDLQAPGYPTLLASWPSNGYLWINVIYDDGSVQAFLDKKYGPDVVRVQSALRPTD